MQRGKVSGFESPNELNRFVELSTSSIHFAGDNNTNLGLVTQANREFRATEIRPPFDGRIISFDREFLEEINNSHKDSDNKTFNLIKQAATAPTMVQKGSMDLGQPKNNPDFKLIKAEESLTKRSHASR